VPPLHPGKDMREKIAAIGIVLTLLLALAGPALAASLGVSPSSVDLEIVGTNSITTTLQAHYYTGEIELSLIDIPLRIEPRFITVEASETPVTVEVTIYGDHCLETQVHEGFIRFTGIAGGTVAMAVQVRAKITNIADGIEPVVETSVEPTDEVVDIEEETEGELVIVEDAVEVENPADIIPATIPEQVDTELEVVREVSSPLSTTAIILISVGGTLAATLLLFGLYRFIESRRY